MFSPAESLIYPCVGIRLIIKFGIHYHYYNNYCQNEAEV